LGGDIVEEAYEAVVNAASVEGMKLPAYKDAKNKK